MGNSTVNIQSKQRGDVTPQIISYAELYGSSDSTNQNSTASSRTLNYAVGSTWQKPIVVPVRTVPQTLNLQSPTAVGLFGAEMLVLRFDLDITDSGKLDNCGPQQRDTYWPACLHLVDEGTVNTYEELRPDIYQDLVTVNTYEPAAFSNTLSPLTWQPVVSVELENVGSGNQYQDCWVDAYLLKQNREVMSQDKFWTPVKSTFYLSVSARNTRRMPGNVKIHIGDQVTSLTDLTSEELNEANIIS